MCRLCGTSQHLECYGWASFPGVRLPDEHFCYSCLLLPREPEVNASMGTLVYKRLALSHILENNPADASALMRAMHLSDKVTGDHEIFNSIIDELQHENYLTRSGTTIMAMMDAESSALALRNYINPLAQISHHFAALKDREKEKDRERAIVSAVRKYTAGRAYLPGHDIEYSQENVEDAFGVSITRWGFYNDESQKRKTTSPPVLETPPAKKVAFGRDYNDEGINNQPPPPYQTALARKASYHEGTPSVDATPPSMRSSLARRASRCEELVKLDRSSPSTVYSLDEVLSEAVLSATSEVQWEEFARSGGSREREDMSESQSIPHSTPKTARR